MLQEDYAVHAVVLAFDAATLFGIVRRPEAASALTAAGGVGAMVGALMAAFVTSETGFGLMRALCWVLYVHAPLLLLAGAAIARRVSPRDAAVHVLGAVALMLVGLDAFVIEPRWLQTVRYAIASPKLTAPVRIVVLSDVQSDDVGAWEADVFARALAEKPDLIVLPGDFVQVDVLLERYPEQAAKMREVMGQLEAPLGVFAVQGNVDWRETWADDVFGGTRVVADRQTTTRDLGPLALSSVGFVDGFTTALDLPGASKFHVAFAHGPDFSLSPNVDADLLIAGHTHGGQVVVPFYGPPLTLSQVPRAWGAGGVTELPGGRHLVVSRGIGMERAHAPRLRFLCRPQLVVIDLSPG